MKNKTVIKKTTKRWLWNVEMENVNTVFIVTTRTPKIKEAANLSNKLYPEAIKQGLIKADEKPRVMKIEAGGTIDL